MKFKAFLLFILIVGFGCEKLQKPTLEIISPIEGESYCLSQIPFEVNIDDDNLNGLWLRIFVNGVGVSEFEEFPFRSAINPRDDGSLGINTISFLAYDAEGNRSDTVDVNVELVNNLPPVFEEDTFDQSSDDLNYYLYHVKIPFKGCYKNDVFYVELWQDTIPRGDRVEGKHREMLEYNNNYLWYEKMVGAFHGSYADTTYFWLHIRADEYDVFSEDYIIPWID